MSEINLDDESTPFVISRSLVKHGSKFINIVRNIPEIFWLDAFVFHFPTFLAYVFVKNC